LTPGALRQKAEQFALIAARLDHTVGGESGCLPGAENAISGLPVIRSEPYMRMTDMRTSRNLTPLLLKNLVELMGDQAALMVYLITPAASLVPVTIVRYTIPPANTSLIQRDGRHAAAKSGHRLLGQSPAEDCDDT
jgi:hypothetical protein